jgi:hypothetical protein
MRTRKEQGSGKNTRSWKGKLANENVGAIVAS